METLYIFFALQVIVWICYMLPVPILPEEAHFRSISLDIVGVILAVYTITYILASFVLGKMMALWGKIRFLNLALILLFITTFLFGVIMMIQEKNIFIVVTILLRLLQGLACGGYSVIIYSMIPEHYPERIEEIFSYMELFAGISTAIAPLIGMLLYELVGSGFTFMIFSGVYLGLLVVVNRNMINFQKDERKKRDINEGSHHHQNLSIMELIKNRQYIVTFGIFTINSIGIFVINPILGDRVKEMTGETTLIGLSFSIFCICYAIGGVSLAHAFKRHKLNKKLLFITSSIMLIIAYLILAFTDEFNYIFIIGLILIGLGEALSVIPYIPEAIELGVRIYPNDYGWVGDMASLFWNIGFALGEFVGPILGGSLTAAYGFTFCTILYALIAAGMLVIYLMFGSVLNRYTQLNEKLLSSYASFQGERNAKFFSYDLPITRTRPVYLRSI